MPIEKKPVEVNRKLFFDPQNPRLPGSFDGDQRQIFRFLVDEIGVEDLLNSMGSSGAIDGDPIIARPAEREGEYYVIEGNRRIAALKLLTVRRSAMGGRSRNCRWSQMILQSP
jgi:hypothetical protein